MRLRFLFFATASLLSGGAVAAPSRVYTALLEEATLADHSRSPVRAGLTELDPGIASKAPFTVTEIRAAEKTNQEDHCKALADRGFCSSQDAKDGMRKFCPGSCTVDALEIDDDSKIQSNPEIKDWAQLSLFDYRRYDPAQCDSEVERHTLEERCADLEDLSRVSDRGWAIIRGLVPRDELEAMAANVNRIKEPARSMCGASSFQPGACFIGPDWGNTYPKLHQKLGSLFAKWVTTGFNEEANLGWPLKMTGGEFISINKWKRTHTPNCVFQALFLAAFNSPRPTSCDKCKWQEDGQWEINPECMIGCYWKDVVMKFARSTVKRIVLAPNCSPPRASSEWRWLKLFGFAENSDGFATSGDGQRMVPWILEMHGWLKQAVNDTSNSLGLIQGYHGWHQDGPGPQGRFHKVFVLVSKNHSTGLSPPVAAGLTNLVAVPATELYGRNCGADEIIDRESVSCKSSFQPGDALFFREDVWHRSQDTEVDRVSLILDVYRVPLRTMPEKKVSRDNVGSARSNEADLMDQAILDDVGPISK